MTEPKAQVDLPASRSRAFAWLLPAFGLAYVAAMQVFNPLRGATNDATLFGYGGKLILQGLVPYRDFWDNKPPAIFYTNAFGYLAGAGHWLGPTVLQGFVLVLTAWLAWRIAGDTFERPAPRGAAFAFTALVLSNPLVLQGGHLTETYQVLPLAATVWLLRPFDPDVRLRRWAFAGATSAVAFLYKPNGAAIGVVALSALALHLVRGRWDVRRAARHLVVYAAGGAAVLAAVTALFAAAGCTRDFWFATLDYNVTAYGELFVERPGVWNRLRLLTAPRKAFQGLLLCVVLSLIATAVRLVAGSRDKPLEDRVALLTAWTAADILLALATGYAYPHYFAPLALSLTFAAGTLFSISVDRRRASIVLGCLALPGAVWIADDLRVLGRKVADTYPSPGRVFMTPSDAERLVEALRPYLRDGEQVLAWGHHHGPQLALGRRPMVGVLSALHLRSHYGFARWGAQYEAALASRPPVVIDTLSSHVLPPAPPSGTDLVKDLATRIDQVLREEYVPLPFEPRDFRAFIRRDRWEAAAHGPGAARDHSQ